MNHHYYVNANILEHLYLVPSQNMLGPDLSFLVLVTNVLIIVSTSTIYILITGLL